MLKSITAFIIVFLLGLSLFLAVSVGVAFGLVWIFPAISFEIGVLIGAVSLGMMCYLFSKITPDKDLLAEDDDYIDKLIVDKFNNEFDLDKLIPPRSTRSRRKRH